LLLFSYEAQSAGEQQLGRILYSKATSLRGVAVPKSETILSGDVLATSDDGSALVELKSGAKLEITKNSSVRFLSDGDKVKAELLAGEVVSESVGKPTLVVTTSKFQFAPSQEGNSRFAVALSKQQATLAGAMKGNLLIRTPDSLGSYIVPEGKYAAIPASSFGVPAQEQAAGGPTAAGIAGTVTGAIPEEVLQRQGQGAEIPLNLNDGINKDDVIRTSNTGRVRIALLDGSFLNVGSGSVMRIIKQDVPTQQTQLELRLGVMRAEVAKRTQPGGSFQVQTPTAIISVVGSVLFIHSYPTTTEVYCVEGLCSVQNINPAIAKQVTLHAEESTTVDHGLPPNEAFRVLPTQLQSLNNQISVEPSIAAASGPVEAGGAAWHVGPLSEATFVFVVAGAAGAAAAIAIPLATKGAASPSAP
jgi:ferric-dicitrate binding protein FerR (iron transport regulator)